MEDTAQTVLSHSSPAAGLAPESPQPLLHSVPGQLPWWGVSIALHVLVIMLAGLISLSIEILRPDETIVMCCSDFGPTARPNSEPLQPTYAIPDSPAGWETLPEVEGLAALGTDRDEIIDALGNVESHTLYDAENPEAEAGGNGTYGESLDDTVGSQTQASAGSGYGYGWGGGSGAGFGADTGEGFGAFGSRSAKNRARIMNVNGFAGMTQRVDLALNWLAVHQERDGHWNAMRFGAFRKVDTAVTGLALLAFLGSGYSEKSGKYQANVRRAVAWLKQQQQSSGLIFDPTDAGNHRGIGYPMAIATLALTEAAGMARIHDTRLAAQRAVDYCVAHQSGIHAKGGWRYRSGEAGDISVTGWFVMALKSAKMAGLQVPESAFEGATRFLNSVEVPEPNDSSVSRFRYRPTEEHEESVYRVTAIGALARIFLGESDDQTTRTVENFVRLGGTPDWTEQKIDLYYWYYGSLATYQVGGSIWSEWNESMVRALAAGQIKAGTEVGSWPIAGAYSDEWGRVGQTALACLCLEVYYRYERVK